MTYRVIRNNSSGNDVVVDQYKWNSVTSVEDSQRVVGSLVFKSIVTSQSIQHWGSLLSSWSNKKELIVLTVNHWRFDVLREQTDPGKKIYAVTNEEYFYLPKSNAEILPNFYSNQEKAHAKMLLQTQHASSRVLQKFVTHTPDFHILPCNVILGYILQYITR